MPIKTFFFSNCNNRLLAINIDMSTTCINIKKIKVPWSLLSESVVYFFATLFQVFDYHNKEYPLQKFEQS